MKTEDLFRKVRTLLTALLGIDPDEVDMDCALVADLGADSLELVELLMAVEEEFDVCVSDEEAEPIRTVRDVVDWLAANLDAAA